MLSAAMRGELGPLAQAVARYQIERRIHNELAKLKAIRGDELEKDIQTPKETNKGDQGGGQEEVSLLARSPFRSAARSFDRASRPVNVRIRTLFFFPERFQRLVNEMERANVSGERQRAIEVDFRGRGSATAEERSEGKNQAHRKADGKIKRTDQIVRVATRRSE